MEDNRNDLWQGGPWEQPAPNFPAPPAVSVPTGGRGAASQRPVLRTRRRRRKWLWALGGILLVAALCLGAGFLSDHIQFSFHRSFAPPFGWERPEEGGEEERNYSTEPPSIPRADTGTGVTVTLEPAAGAPLSYTELYQQCAPSIVSIEAASQRGYSTGTGVILTEDGYIITNAHVVAGADAVQVLLSDSSVWPAMLVGFNAREDLAVLKLDAHGLTPARFGDSFALQIGDPVAAIGDPLGYRSTLTDGIVSALDREVDVDGTTMVLIQTNAAINFGNSGGALINQYGQVVGITTVKIVADDGSAEALGFAIPSQRVKYVTDALIDGKEIRTGMFGFTVLTRPAAGGGLELQSVDAYSDAWAKGLRAGDIITAIDGQPITGTQDLIRLKQTRGPGDSLAITYLRRGTYHTVDVELVDADPAP